MSSRVQRSIPLGGRYRQVSLYNGGDKILLVDFTIYYFQTSNTDSIPSPDHSPHRPVVERHNPLHYITIIQGRRPSGRINDAFVGQADGSPTKRDDHVICQPPPYEEIGLSTIQPPSYEEATKAVWWDMLCDSLHRALSPWEDEFVNKK